MNHDEPRPSFQLMLSNTVMRHLYKILYKFTHPKSYKHNRRYWPYYAVERNADGGIAQVFFKKRLVVNNSPAASAQKKCMLIATGPSVNNIPKEAFKQPNMDYIGVNGAISLDDIQFKYYVIIDHNFTQKRFDLVLKVLRSSCTFFTTPRCLDLILRKISPEDIRCQIKLIEPITEGEVERFLGERKRIDPIQDHYFVQDGKYFSKHIQDAVFDYFTVAYVALQIIHSLGAKEIYLAGLDMNNFNQPRFYESSDNKQPTMLDQYLGELLPAFNIAAAYLKDQSIQVYNLSPTSAITSFEKMSPEIFKTN